MRVTIRLFARLREIAGAGQVERDLQEGATLGTVWNLLVADHPALAPYSGSVSGAVNADYARMDTSIGDGDEVAFLPPVSGG
jgi:molybdopterin converting factor subunit 1